MPAAPQTFGRRAGAQSTPRPVRAAPQLAAEMPEQSAPIATPEVAHSPSHETLLDQELIEWKKARRFQIPWRPLCWMASLSFGIGSLVLPDSVNDSVDWLLYALMAASFCAGFMKRREAKNIQQGL